LIEDPDHFEPIFMESVSGGEPVLIVDEWCEGYVRGVALTADKWSSAGSEVADLLAPIRAFTEETNWLAHEIDDAKQVDTLRDAIVPNVRAIHAHWLPLRGADSPKAAPWRRDTPRVGRNDPCPCGSGKKYKMCCLQ
jgi:uncharacterized protein